MSIIKFANAKTTRSDALKRGIEYILNTQKTLCNLIYCNGIYLDSPYEDMQTVQALLRKTTGRKYIHYILSFDLGVTADRAYVVSTRCAEYFADEYQYVLAVHTNTANVHAHIIMNSVNVHTGNKFSQSKSQLFRFRDFVNQCLMEQGLNPISPKNSTKLVCEEVIDDEFELDYDTLLVESDYERKFHYTFSEVNQLHAYGYDSSYFGPIDYVEAKQLQTAEVYHSYIEEIIRFFQGKVSVLPDGINIADAELLYEQWLEGQQCLEEEADYGFFSKHS